MNNVIDVPEKPTISLMSDTAELEIGQQVTLACKTQYESYPKVTEVRWLQEDEFVLDSTTSSLTLTPDKAKNRYKCYVISSYGHSSFSDLYQLDMSGDLVYY